MHDKPNGSNEIVGMAIDGDIHYCLLKYSTTQLSVPVIIKLSYKSNTDHYNTMKAIAAHHLLLC